MITNAPKSKRTIAIVQSNYLPWRGYFDMIRSVDDFILLDTVQYTRQDWRNRNLIKTSQGPQWITIAVQMKGRLSRSIAEIRVVNPRWAEDHIRKIEANYQRAAAYDEVGPWLFDLLRDAAHEPLLSRINETLLAAIAARLDIRTPLRRCTDLIDRDEMAALEPSARLLTLCRAAGATCYLSGPAARDYLDQNLFRAAGIEVAWMDYSEYPEYPQLWGPFEPRVSIIDLLLNTGVNAFRYLGRCAPSSPRTV